MSSAEADKEVGYTFIWKIENFIHRFPFALLKSPNFIIENDVSSAWYLSLPELSASVHIISLERDHEYGVFDENQVVECEFSILSAKGIPLTKIPTRRIVFEKSMTHQNRELLITKRELEQRREEILPENNLTICCRIWRIDRNPVQIGLCFGLTKIGMKKTSFVWKIEDFSDLRPKESRYIFLASTAKEMEIFLSDGPQDNQIQIEISQSSTYRARENLLVCQISLLNAVGEVVNFRKYGHYFPICSKNTWKFPCFITKDLLLENKSMYLPNDVLRLRCDCSVFFRVVLNRIEEYGKFSPQSSNPIYDCLDDTLYIEDETDAYFHTLKADLKHLYESGDYSDISLRAGGVLFPAHRNILSARSLVFNDMFCKRDVTERGTDIVDIPDLEEDIMDRVLTFLYTDTLGNLHWEKAMQLYAAANKYDIPLLKESCKDILMSNLRQSNACEILVLADKHRDDDLKTDVQDFILRHEKNIFSSGQWKYFMKKHVQLAAETMHFALLKK